MNIRKKTLYIATSAVLVLIVVLYIITRVVLLDKFELLQKKEAEKNMLRVSEVLGTMQSNLNSITRDWSSWNRQLTDAKDSGIFFYFFQSAWMLHDEGRRPEAVRAALAALGAWPWPMPRSFPTATTRPRRSPSTAAPA
jgi:hypothetical protein